MATFAELGLSENLVSSLTQMGFEEPTPIQEAAIPALLSGADVLGQAAPGRPPPVRSRSSSAT